MITLQVLSQHLEDLLTPSNFNDYCPNGVQVEGKKEIRSLAFAVSASQAAIEQAVAKKADALIAHHGMFWQKDPYPIVGIKKNKLDLLLKHQMSLLAYHLPLDAHQEVGNNWKAARDLHMKDLKPFFPLDKGWLGVKGAVPSLPVEDFKRQLEAYYGHPAHCALGGPEKIHSAAIISGGAHRSIDRAIQEGVDCFITGSFDEPIWDIAHEQKIHFFALGHYATERVGVLALMKHLQQQFNLSCSFIELPNPF